MKKSLRLISFALALTACLSLVSHADCHCTQISPTVNCNLCHSTIYTAPVLHTPSPIFQAQESAAPVKILNWEPSVIAVNLTRGPPSR